MAEQLYSQKDIATEFGVKPGTVHVWRWRHPGFPDPTGYLADRPYWDEAGMEAIRRWYNARIL